MHGRAVDRPATAAARCFILADSSWRQLLINRAAALILVRESRQPSILKVATTIHILVLGTAVYRNLGSSTKFSTKFSTRGTKFTTKFGKPCT